MVHVWSAMHFAPLFVFCGIVHAADVHMVTDSRKCETQTDLVPLLAPCMVKLPPSSPEDPHFEIHYGYDTYHKEVTLCAVNKKTNDEDFRGWVSFGPGTNKMDAKVVTAEGPGVGKSNPGPVVASLLPLGADPELEDFTTGQVMNEELDDGRCVCFHLKVEKLEGVPLHNVSFVWAIGDKPRVDGVIHVGAGTIELDFLSSLTPISRMAPPASTTSTTPAATTTAAPATAASDTASVTTTEASATEARTRVAPATSGCDDDWVSSTKSTCQDYKRLEYCTESGEEGKGWIYQPTTFHDFADEHGRTALVCTVCGCGVSGSQQAAGKTITAATTTIGATTIATSGLITATTSITSSTSSLVMKDNEKNQGARSTGRKRSAEPRAADTGNNGFLIFITLISVILVSIVASMLYVHYGRGARKSDNLYDEEAVDSPENLLNAQEANASLGPCATFESNQPGFVFNKGVQGVGYYKDGNQPTSIGEPSRQTKEDTDAGTMEDEDRTMHREKNDEGRTLLSSDNNSALQSGNDKQSKKMSWRAYMSTMARKSGYSGSALARTDHGSAAQSFNMGLARHIPQVPTFRAVPSLDKSP